MKRYEKMSKEEIIAMFLTADITCDGCLVTTDFCNNTKGNCFEVLAKWLKEEIETKPRIKTIKTKEEFIKAREQYTQLCQHQNGCGECRYNNYSETCFTEFLWEEVEV